MRKRKRLCGVLLIITALIIMTLPVSEADAASSASDFVMEGSTLVKYRGTEKNVSVPDTVEVIGESAFEDKTHIELVVLPNSVKRIEAYAFWGCDNLDTVVLGRGLTEVGDYAFAGCKGLEQMTIPANVTSIGIQAFGDCVNMTDITIPVETVKLHESAFDGCAKLTIHCQEGSVADLYAKEFYEKQKEMPEYEDVPGYNDNNEDDNQAATPEPTAQPSAAPVPYETGGAILGSTWVVGNQAVVFVDAVDLEAKQGAPASVPNGTEIEEALSEKVRMTADSIPKYTIVDGRIVADQAYYRSSSLGEVELPEGIAEIGQFSFARSSLTKIRVPDGVTDIGYGAFYHCDFLTEVTLPETLMNVEPKAFSKTGWVERFLQGTGEGDFLISGGVLVAYRGNRAEVTVPDGVRVIASEAFLGHTEIEKVSFPDSLRVIGEAAFEECSGLRDIHLNQGLEQIKDRAFCGAAGAGVVIPATVKQLGLRAFEGSEITCEGEQPDVSYEASATRLSNAAFRDAAEQTGEAGVSVIGPEGVYASLEAAVGRYELTIRDMEDTSALRKAWERVMEDAFPDSMLIYELTLSDESGIPLTKLGLQTLTVTIPVPDSLKGQELKAVTVDRNGQLETVAATRVLLNGEEALCIQTTRPSVLGIYSVGEAGAEELTEMSVSMEAAAVPLGGTDGVSARILRSITGAVFLAAGVVLSFSAHKNLTRKNLTRKKRR